MSAEHMVDAAPVGFDQGEPVTLRACMMATNGPVSGPRRRTMSQQFLNSAPGPRYGIGVPTTAL